MEILQLSWNAIGNKGLKEICNGLKATKTIKTLELSMAEISKVDCLREVLLNNSQLEKLDLSWNGIWDEGLKEICNGLKTTKTIKTLELSMAAISKVDCLREVLQQLTIGNFAFKWKCNWE